MTDMVTFGTQAAAVFGVIAGCIHDLGLRRFVRAQIDSITFFPRLIVDKILLQPTANGKIIGGHDYTRGTCVCTDCLRDSINRCCGPFKPDPCPACTDRYIELVRRRDDH